MSTVPGLVASVACLLPMSVAEEAARSIAWGRDQRAAYAEAERRGAPLLIHFRSDHCERTDVGGGAVAEAGTRDQATDCDRMEQDVWSSADVVAAAGAFVPVLTGDLADQTLKRRYSVGTIPTTLLADPWGNEIVPMVRYVPREKVRLLLTALARDFSPVREASMALSKDRANAGALLELAGFYESHGLREIADVYYQRAGLSDAAKRDAAVRRKAAVGRGTNLLQMGRAGDAAEVFRSSYRDERSGEGADVVLFGWMMAELQQARFKEAERPYRELLARFPDSKYTAKAKENFAAATARRPDAW